MHRRGSTHISVKLLLIAIAGREKSSSTESDSMVGDGALEFARHILVLPSSPKRSLSAARVPVLTVCHLADGSGRPCLLGADVRMGAYEVQ